MNEQIEGELPASKAAAMMLSRAEKYAEATTEEGKTTLASIEVVEFQLNRERYAIESSCVFEICRWRQPTIVPFSPKHLHGIINHHGQILPLFDLRPLFNLAITEAEETTSILVVGSDKPLFALLAENVTSISRIASSDMRDLPDSTSSKNGHLFKGICLNGLAVLDVQILARDERLTIEQGCEVS